MQCRLDKIEEEIMNLKKKWRKIKKYRKKRTHKTWLGKKVSNTQILIVP